MMERRDGDEGLRALWASDGPLATDQMRLDADTIWRGVTGELSPERLVEVLEIVGASPADADAWSGALLAHREAVSDGWDDVIGDVEDTAQDTGLPADNVVRGPRRWWVAAAGLAAAAAASALVLLPSGRVDDPPAWRDGAAGPISALVADGTALPADAFTLRWSDAGEGAVYTVRLTASDLSELSLMSGLSATEYTVPPLDLSGVAPGDRAYWQVEATLPDGGRVSSETYWVVLR